MIYIFFNHKFTVHLLIFFGNFHNHLSKIMFKLIYLYSIIIKSIYIETKTYRSFFVQIDRESGINEERKSVGSDYQYFDENDLDSVEVC